MQSVWDVDGLIPRGEKQQCSRQCPRDTRDNRDQVGNTPLGRGLPLSDVAELSRFLPVFEFREQAHGVQKIPREHRYEPVKQFYMTCVKGRLKEPDGEQRRCNE
jgi:hypothetical protein